MKNEILCFSIEGKELYMEQCLVEYMGIPIFFLCKSDEQYYVVLYADMEEGKYFIVAPAITDVFNLLHGKLAMRDIFLKQEFFWEVLSEDEISKDYVTKKRISEITVSELPKENALYQVLTSDVKEYLKKFDSDFLDQAYYRSMKIPRGDSYVCDVVVQGTAGIQIVVELSEQSQQSQQRWERLKAYQEMILNMPSDKIEDVSYIVDDIADFISIAA